MSLSIDTIARQIDDIFEDIYFLTKLCDSFFSIKLDEAIFTK